MATTGCINVQGIPLHPRAQHPISVDRRATADVHFRPPLSTSTMMPHARPSAYPTSPRQPSPCHPLGRSLTLLIPRFKPFCLHIFSAHSRLPIRASWLCSVIGVPASDFHSKLDARAEPFKFSARTPASLTVTAAPLISVGGRSLSAAPIYAS
ncbi:hypothetical protein P280DRAFT_317041 [Massarina eburnea CBS 473.64]|uniref:Uncharacterized protein n=1 Tax=Massarina eburnea CBS 473.64 TaxID=1395130 RepID=A0A6A6S4G4_9PLEO|nr:hypothetical protein P280DRAFT_317041 [Massarina eburnea CBS 473.64]